MKIDLSTPIIVTDWLPPEVAAALTQTVLYENVYGNEHDIAHYMGWNEIKRGFTLFADKLHANEFKLPAMQELPSDDAPAFKGTALTAVARLALWLQQLVVMGGAAHPLGIMPDGSKTPLSVLLAQLLTDVYVHFPGALEDDVHWPRHFTKDSAPLQEILIGPGLLPDPGTLHRGLRHQLLQSFAQTHWVDLAIKHGRFNILKFIASTNAGWSVVAPKLLVDDGLDKLVRCSFREDIPRDGNSAPSSAFPHRPTEVVDVLAARVLLKRLISQGWRSKDSQVGNSWFKSSGDPRPSAIAVAIENLLAWSASKSVPQDALHLLEGLASVLGYPQHATLVALPQDRNEVSLPQEVASAMCRWLLDAYYDPDWTDTPYGQCPLVRNNRTDRYGEVDLQRDMLRALAVFIGIRGVRDWDYGLPRYTTSDGVHVGALRNRWVIVSACDLITAINVCDMTYDFNSKCEVLH